MNMTLERVPTLFDLISDWLSLKDGRCEKFPKLSFDGKKIWDMGGDSIGRIDDVSVEIWPEGEWTETDKPVTYLAADPEFFSKLEAHFIWKCL